MGDGSRISRIWMVLALPAAALLLLSAAPALPDTLPQDDAGQPEVDGSWRYPGENSRRDPNANYRLLETYCNLRVLVEMIGFHRGQSCLQRAAEFVLSCQTSEGDIRGILGNQYMPYYHGAMLELLIKAGYENDLRVAKGLDWLVSMRQDDGGWLVPAQQIPSEKKTGEFWKGPARPPERSLPHSHLATGMILRAFAAHPSWRKRTEIVMAPDRTPSPAKGNTPPGLHSARSSLPPHRS